MIKEYYVLQLSKFVVQVINLRALAKFYHGTWKTYIQDLMQFLKQEDVC